MRTQVALAVCLLALAGCGGGGGDSPPPTAPSPPPVVPPPPPPPPVIGSDGGTITEGTGASVIFPAGAVSTDTTFRIATDSTGAPPVPAQMGGIGNMYVVTPHGGDFEEEVEVRIPAPSITLLPTQELKIAKAEPGGNWVILNDAKLVDGKLSVRVHDFSFFMVVVVTYPLPIAQAVPLSFTTSLVCQGFDTCTDIPASAFTGTFTAVGNNGQIPANWCGQDANLYIMHGSDVLRGPRMQITGSGGTVTATATVGLTNSYFFGIYYGYFHEDGGYCTYTSGAYRMATFRAMPAFPAVSVFSSPAELDVVEGLTANLDVIVGGGAVERWNGDDDYQRTPQFNDQATVDWERSDNGGASWRVIARSFQSEGNPLPYGTGNRWQPWSVRHAFTATPADQGALLRARACYTPPTPETAPPCSLGTSTRIHVLQQSALPAFVEQPRSVLVSAVETANFSVSVSGLPAPTLQWQTRPANSSGEWTNVGVGTGATTATYTTPPRVLTDNGEQYRVVATNALGSVASAPVTVSVSDLAVAPSITTQPSPLSVASGGDAVFAVAAYGTEAMSYQWRFNGTNIAGANSPILRLSGVTDANVGTYSVYVSNNAGNITSNSAVLTVTAGTPASVPPTIVTQPASVVVNVGNTATFAVGVDGTGPLSFQWRRDGVNIAGANRASLTFNSVALPNAGIYSVVVSNSAGAVVSGTVTLDVRPEVGMVSPSITSEPSTVIVPAGGSAMLAVGAIGSGPLSYQWSFNGAAIPGATLPVLTLDNVGNANVGEYTVVVSNSLSSTTSEPAQLILLGAPVITQGPVAATGIQGNTATFSVTANGSGLRYQWMLNGNPIPGATEATYTTPMLVEANSGAVYSVMVYNGAGLVISQGAVLTVQVIVAPSLLQSPASSTVAPGQTATLCLRLGGTMPIEIELRRWVNDEWSTPLFFSNLVNTDEQCFLSPVLQLADTGAQFRFFARNAAGEIMTDIATITVTPPPPQGITQTTLVSMTLAGGPGEYGSRAPSVSADGRYVAFLSYDWNLVPGFPNSSSLGAHAYLRDLATGTTTLIDRPITGMPSSNSVTGVKLSANGRYAVFATNAGDLVEGDTNNMMDVFRRDLVTGNTIRLSLLPNGNQVEGGGPGNYDSRLSISADGRWVTFLSAYDMTGDGSETGNYLMYVLDAESNYRRHFAGTLTEGPIGTVAMSDDGKWIAYAPSIPPPGQQTINLYNIEQEQTTEVYRFEQSSTAWLTQGISISADGRYVAFGLRSAAVTGSASSQVMVADRQNPGVATLVSTGANGVGDANSLWPQITADGRYVLFSTYARNLAALPNTSAPCLMLRDLVGGTVTAAGHDVNGAIVPLVTEGSVDGSQSHAISRDASTIAFVTGFMQVYAEPRP